MVEQGKASSARSSIYGDMTLPGLIGYILDKHLLNFALIFLMLFAPASFGFLFWAAKSDELQTKLLIDLIGIASSNSLFSILGWIIVIFLVFSLLKMRAIYKSEIHRLGDEKNVLLAKLGIQKKTSGHDERK